MALDFGPVLIRRLLRFGQECVSVCVLCGICVYKSIKICITIHPTEGYNIFFSNQHMCHCVGNRIFSKKMVTTNIDCTADHRPDRN